MLVGGRHSHRRLLLQCEIRVHRLLLFYSLMQLPTHATHLNAAVFRPSPHRSPLVSFSHRTGRRDAPGTYPGTDAKSKSPMFTGLPFPSEISNLQCEIIPPRETAPVLFQLSAFHFQLFLWLGGVVTFVTSSLPCYCASGWYKTGSRLKPLLELCQSCLKKESTGARVVVPSLVSRCATPLRRPCRMPEWRLWG